MHLRPTILFLGLTAAVSPAALATTLGPTLASVAEDHGEWVGDFDEAAKLAAKEGKAVLIDFTGSDWCGWCIKLHEEVFAHDEFLIEAKKMFVLTALDFPRGEEAKAKVPNPERNEELRAKYGVTGFPTILLVTPEGDVLGRTGYEAGGPEPYIANLKKMYEEGKVALKRVKQLASDYDAAAADAKAGLHGQALDLIDELGADHPIVAPLMPIAREAFAGNDAQLKRRSALALLMGEGFDADLIEAAAALDPKNADGYFSKVVKTSMQAVQMADQLPVVCGLFDRLDALGPIADKEFAAEVYFLAAYWNFNFLEQAEKGKQYAAKAKALVEDPRKLEALEQILAD